MYTQTNNQTHRSFQIYVSPTFTNTSTGTTLLYTHSGNGTFFITGLYYYCDSASGAVGTFCNMSVGTNAPSYNNVTVGGSPVENTGSNFQYRFTLSDIINPITGISGSQEIYANITTKGTNFITGSIIMVGYFSNNAGDVLNQDS